MTAPRTRKEEKRYDKWKKFGDRTVCVFCDVNNSQDRFVAETPHFFIIKNDYPYSMWDHQGVADHLMVTPKRHIQELSGLSDEEKVEYVNLLQEYESKGYSIFTRSFSSITKSVPHLHTHFIKPDGVLKKFMFFINKPFLRITK